MIWGWATWKNAWKKYDVEMKEWKDKKIKSYLKKNNTPEVYKFLKKRFNQLHKNYKDTWDIQWYFACTKNKWLCMTPKANLITNIGINGTHSDSFYDTLFLKLGEINPKNLKGPKKFYQIGILIIKFINILTLKKHYLKKYYSNLNFT